MEHVFLGMEQQDCLYPGQRQMGFLPLDWPQGEDSQTASLMGGGFLKQPWLEGDLPQMMCGPDGVALMGERWPLRWRAQVPENGIYRVRVTLAGGRQPGWFSLYAMRRSFVRLREPIAAGETKQLELLAYVSAYIPAAHSRELDDRAVIVSFLGENAHVQSIHVEAAQAPALFLAGDSTLTDQVGYYPYYPVSNIGGWGQALPLHLADIIAVCNQAHSGLTGTCFRTDGHWDILQRSAKQGDFLLVQFGHNDQKRRNLAAMGGYADNLRWYLSQAREMGLHAALVTPIARASWKDGQLQDLLARHSDACKAVGQEFGVPVVDLHEKSLAVYRTLGPEGTSFYFGPGDATHTNDFGACRMAAVVAEALKAGMPALMPYITQGPAPWTPQADEPRPQPPQGFVRRPMAVKPPYVDISGTPQLEWIKKAGEKGLLDPCVLYFHPLDPLPRGQFLFLLFKALRLSPGAPVGNGVRDIEPGEWDAPYVYTAIAQGLWRGDCFRPDDDVTFGEMAQLALRGTQVPGDCWAVAQKAGLLPAGCTQEQWPNRGQVMEFLVKFMDWRDSAPEELPESIEVHPI